MEDVVSLTLESPDPSLRSTRCLNDTLESVYLKGEKRSQGRGHFTLHIIANDTSRHHS